MCTLILIDRVVPGVPVLVAANRDEYFARPAAPPSRLGGTRVSGAAGAPGASAGARPPWIVAPQDLEAGGTWMGLNQEGLFVGLTNRPVSTPDRSHRSRGLLVLDALSRRAAPDVARDLEGPLAGPYNPFHLVYADGRRAYLSFLREESGLETQELDPGIHVVCNRDPEDPGSNKVTRIRAALDRVDLEQPFEDLRRALADVLGSHPDAEHPFENPCVHTPDYGTRSAALIAGGPERRGFWFAAGPPCENKFDDLSRLLA